MNRDDILAVASAATLTKEVDVEGWGSVTFRYPTFDDMARLQEANEKEKGAKSMALSLCILIAEKDGSRMFTDGDVPTFMKMPYQKVLTLFSAAKDAVLDSSEEAEKN